MEELSKKKNTLAAEQDKDESGIDSGALSSIEGDDDVTAALSTNPFKLGLIRFGIKIKNRLTLIPLFFTMATLFVIFIGIHYVVAATGSNLSHNDTNSLLFFINLICQLVLVLCYINVNARHITKKRKYMFLGFFFAIAALSIYFDVDFIVDANIEMSLFNSINQIKNDSGDVQTAINFIIAHLSFLSFSVVLAAVEPFVQPLTKKIHFKK